VDNFFAVLKIKRSSDNAVVAEQFTYYLKNLYKKLTDFNEIPPVNQIGGNSLNEYHY